MNGKSVQRAALRRHVAPPAFTDYWAAMIGFVGQLAVRWPQIALPRRLTIHWAFLMIGLVVQIAASQTPVALPERLLMVWLVNVH